MKVIISFPIKIMKKRNEYFPDYRKKLETIESSKIIINKLDRQ